MIAYLKLQWRIANRKMVDFGLPAFIGYPLFLLVFVFFSNTLFEKTRYAIYIYLIFLISSVLKIRSFSKDDFLNNLFSNQTFFKIRLLENGLISLPFLVFLIFKSEFMAAVAAIFIAVVLSVISYQKKTTLIIPTPFKKEPFEFLIGFRNQWYILLFIYAISIGAIYGDNFNLGISTIIFITLLASSFYTNLEDEYILWNYGGKANEFLIHKIRKAVLHLTILCVPVFIVLGVFFWDRIDKLLLIYMICNCHLSTIVLIKYSNFPSKPLFPEVFLSMFSFLLFPILIPYYYIKSSHKLSNLLK